MGVTAGAVGSVQLDPVFFLTFFFLFRPHFYFGSLDGTPNTWLHLLLFMVCIIITALLTLLLAQPNG